MDTRLSSNRRTLVTNRIETFNLVEVVNWYFDHYVPSEKEHTHRAKAQDFEWLLMFAAYESRCSVGELQVADVSPALLHGFREYRLREGDAPSTVNRRMATVKHFCRKVKERAPYWINPSEGMRDIPTEEHELRGIEQAEAESIVEAAYTVGTSLFFRHRSGLICLIALGVGLRAMEVANLRVGSLSDDFNWFKSVRCKGGKARHVYIRSDVRDAIREWLPVRERALSEHLAGYNHLPQSGRMMLPLLPTIARANAKEPESCVLDYKTIWRTFAKACELADREHVNPHRFRHAFARNLMDSSKDVSVVANALGHSGVNITMRYLSNKQDELAKAIENSRRRKA